MTLVGFKITNHPQQVGKRGASDTVDERITPAKVFVPLRDEFAFTLDAAANDRNRQTLAYFDLDSDGLEQSWAGHRVWCNPPYSDIRPWVEKAWAEHRSGCPLIAMLLPANRCEQGWWQDLIEPFRDGRGPLETRFYRSRFNFGLPDNPEGKFHSSPPFGCVLVIWRHGSMIDPTSCPICWLRHGAHHQLCGNSGTAQGIETAKPPRREAGLARKGESPVAPEGSDAP